MENTVLYGAISKLTTDQKNCWPFCTVTDIPKRKWQHYCIQTCWQSIRTCRQSISVFPAFKTVSEILLQRSNAFVLQMRKTHPFRFCGTNGFLLVEAPPQAPVNAIFQIAATRFFQIAAITYFVCVSTFTPEQDSKSTRISMDVLPTIYWHMPSICYNTTKQNADADQAAAWQAPAFSIFRREPCCQYKSSAHPQLHLKI